MNYENIERGYIYPSTTTQHVTFIEIPVQKHDNTKK